MSANRANIGWHLANMTDNERLAAGSASGTGPSPKIWSDCPVLSIMMNPQKGFYYFNDFLQNGTLTAGTVLNGLLLTQNTSEGTVANDPTVQGGVILISAASTSAAKGPTLQIVGCGVKPEPSTIIRMEWRCRVSKDAARIFMGLCDDSETAIVADDSIVTGKDIAGFMRDSGTGSTDWSCVVSDGTNQGEADDKCLSVATAYEKYGIVIYGDGTVAGDKVEFWHDGELVYTENTLNRIPDAVITPVFVACGDGADQPVIHLDWIRIVVENQNDGSRI